MIILLVGILAGILYLLQRLLYRHMWQRSIKVSISFADEVVTEQGKTELLEIVENAKWLPLSALKVKFQCSRKLVFVDASSSAVTDQYYRNDLFSIMPFRRVTRKHQVVCPHRGYFSIQKADLVGADLFLSTEMMTTVSCDAHVYVVPDLEQIQEAEPLLSAICGEIRSKVKRVEDPFAFCGIREYQTYDQPKAINWMASAKTGELKVNQHEDTAVGSVRIFLNLEDQHILRHEELLEQCIRISAYLATRLLGEQIRVRLYANARDCMTGQVLQLEGSMDCKDIDTIYKALARLDLDQETVDFEESFGAVLREKDTAFSIFLSSERYGTFQNILEEFLKTQQEQGAGESDRRLLWLCPIHSYDCEEDGIRDGLRTYTRLIPFRDVQEH